MKQRGFILVFFALTLTVFLALASLAIDIPKFELQVTGLQRSADAAALAGAVRLSAPSVGNSEQQWKDAKRVVLAAIKQNAIYGMSLFYTPDPDLEDVGDPLYDGGSDYQSNVYSISGGSSTLTIRIERGLYWVEPVTDGVGAVIGTNVEFESLEIDSNNVDPTTKMCRVPLCPPNTLGTDAANGMQVMLTIDNAPSVFGQIIGFNGFTNITRSAVAALDTPP